MEPKITKEQGEKYLKSGAGTCPVCGSPSIEGESVQVEAMTAWQDVSCHACGARWQDVYAMRAIGDPETGEDIAVLHSKPPRKSLKTYPHKTAGGKVINVTIPD